MCLSCLDLTKNDPFEQKTIKMKVDVNISLLMFGYFKLGWINLSVVFKANCLDICSEYTRVTSQDGE